jgi:peptide/nickel transport system permease protein
LFTYVIKRILLMIPTFFAISLMIFMILNFAPGTPGASLAGGEGSQSAEDSVGQRESYQIFKEQFNLDKPVLFNTRFRLDTATVRATILDILNRDRSVSISRQIEAQVEIEDWGNYAVPALVEILSSSDDVEIRSYASRRLPLNAKRRLRNLYGGRSSAEDRAHNKEVLTENRQLSALTFTAASLKKEQDQVSAAWQSWLKENSDRWDYTGSKKLVLLMTDTRFFKYWTNLIFLDFGVSHVDKRPVLKKVFKKLRYSLSLSFTAVLLIYFVSVPLGIWSSVNQNTASDRALTVVLFMLYSLPSFFTGVVLLNFLTRGAPYQVFPTSGFESLDTSGMTTLTYLGDVLWHLVLPIICLSYAGLAALSRYARTGLLDVIRADYIRTARAKGLPEFVVIIKHAARNGMIPILTLLATLLPTLVGGSVVIEVIFGIPGMGLYVWESILLRDYNAIMAVLLISSGLTLVGLLLSDLSYALVDPRITFD